MLSTTSWRIFHYEDMSGIRYFRRRNASAIEGDTAFEAMKVFLASYPAPVKGGYYFISPDSSASSVGGCLMEVVPTEVDQYSINHVEPRGGILISQTTTAPTLTERWDAAIETLRAEAPLLVRMLADVGEDGPTADDLTEIEALIARLTS